MLETIVRAAQPAPNWVNLQLVSIIATRDAVREERLAVLYGGQQHVAEVPLFLVFCADYHRVSVACEMHGQALEPVMQDVDTIIVAAHEAGIALEAAVIAAESLGLGTVPTAICGRMRRRWRRFSACPNMFFR